MIAFPKTGGGFDPLTSAPAPITAEQRKEAGVDVPLTPFRERHPVLAAPGVLWRVYRAQHR